MENMLEEKVQYLYNRFRFGNFSFDVHRDAYYDFFFNEFVPRIRDTDKVYDVGCGKGYFSRKLVDKCKIQKENIFCIDYSEDNIKDLKELGFKGETGNNLSLNVESNSADKTISNGVIHHTNDPEKCLDELIRITKNDGLIYLAVYSKRNPYFDLVWFLGTPARYIFWNVNKAIIEKLIFPLVNIFFIQPLGLIFFKEFIKKDSAKVLFMDQLISPNVFCFWRENLVNKIINRNCEVLKMEYFKFYLMDLFLIKVKK